MDQAAIEAMRTAIGNLRIVLFFFDLAEQRPLPPDVQAAIHDTDRALSKAIDSLAVVLEPYVSG